MTHNPLFEAARALIPDLRVTPTNPTLYTSFAVAGDQHGTYHLLSHYRPDCLLYVRVHLDQDDLIELDLSFKRATDDLFFYGCEYLGELFMQPSVEVYDCDWYQNNLRLLFRACLDSAPAAFWNFPVAFQPLAVPKNNGPVTLRLLQSIRHRKQGSQPSSAELRYAF